MGQVFHQPHKLIAMKQLQQQHIQLSLIIQRTGLTLHAKIFLCLCLVFIMQHFLSAMNHLTSIPAQKHQTWYLPYNFQLDWWNLKIQKEKVWQNQSLLEVKNLQSRHIHNPLRAIHLKHLNLKLKVLRKKQLQNMNLRARNQLSPCH